MHPSLAAAAQPAVATQPAAQLTRAIPLDPTHPITLNNGAIGIPDLLPKLQAMEQRLEGAEEDNNASDDEVFKKPVVAPPSSRKRPLAASASLRSVEEESTFKSRGKGVPPAKSVDPFVPAGPKVLSLIRLLPPPSKPNPGASINIQREVRAMLKEQEQEGPSACGFYFDPVRSTPLTHPKTTSR